MSIQKDVNTLWNSICEEEGFKFEPYSEKQIVQLAYREMKRRAYQTKTNQLKNKVWKEFKKNKEKSYIKHFNTNTPLDALKEDENKTE